MFSTEKIEEKLDLTKKDLSHDFNYHNNSIFQRFRMWWSRGSGERKRAQFKIHSFNDLFGDTYDHPFNDYEEIKEVMLDWPADS